MRVGGLPISSLRVPLGTPRRGFRNASDMIAIGVSRLAQKYHDLKEPWAIHDAGARERMNREKAMCRNVWLLCNLREMKRYENGFRTRDRARQGYYRRLLF